jgi:chromosome segregation ATPase
LIGEKDALKRTVGILEDRLQQHESMVGDTSKSLAAMHVVSQQSSDRLGQVENELRVKLDEISDLKSALDASWQNEKDNKKLIHTLSAQNEALTKKIEENESTQEENIKVCSIIYYI